MSNYRQLTQTEIEVLENNVCWAEDWQRVMVDENFIPYNFHRVMFYGDIRLVTSIILWKAPRRISP